MASHPGGAAGDILRRVVAGQAVGASRVGAAHANFTAPTVRCDSFTHAMCSRSFVRSRKMCDESQTRLVRNSMVWDYSARTDNRSRIKAILAALPEQRVRDFQRRYRSLVEKAKAPPPPMKHGSYAIVSALLRRLGRAMRDGGPAARRARSRSSCARAISSHVNIEPLDFNLDAFSAWSLRSRLDEGARIAQGDDEAVGSGDKEPASSR